MNKLRAKKFFSKTNRNLFIELVRAKFKLYDHNSLIGVAWSLLGPFSLLLVMYFIFRQHFGQKIYAYPLYLLLGISCVNYFITTTAYIMKIFPSNRELVLNSIVRREMLVLSELFMHTYKFAVELLFCLILSMFYGLFSWTSLLLLLPLFAAYLLLVFGITLMVSLFYCFSRDVDHIWMLVSRLLFFITPVFFMLNSMNPLVSKLAYWLNPLTPFVVSFHDIYMGKGNIDMFVYLHSLASGLGFFAVGYYFFVVFEDRGIELI